MSTTPPGNDAGRKMPQTGYLLLVAALCALLIGGCAHGPAPAAPAVSLSGASHVVAVHTPPPVTAGIDAHHPATPPPVTSAGLAVPSPAAPVATPGTISPAGAATPVQAPAPELPVGDSVQTAPGAELSPSPNLIAAASVTAATDSPASTDVTAGSGLEEAYDGDDAEEDGGEEDKPAEAAAVEDPLEPFNRAMFTFNDRLYFWVLKPVSRGYNFVVPEDVRISIRNVFRNIAFPVRFVNCLLQANLTCAGTEVGRFIINSTFGIGGLFDVAATEAFNLPRREIELGQTLGVYGWESSVYINWPFIGPSTPRDTIGLTGDVLLDPLAWLQPWYLSLGVAAYYKLNNVSLSIGDYEALKEAAIDPYVAVRDAYIQHRRQFIKKARQEPAGMPAPPSQTIPPKSDPQSNQSD